MDVHMWMSAFGHTRADIPSVYVLEEGVIWANVKMSWYNPADTRNGHLLKTSSEVANWLHVCMYTHMRVHTYVQVYHTHTHTHKHLQHTHTHTHLRDMDGVAHTPTNFPPAHTASATCVASCLACSLGATNGAYQLLFPAVAPHLVTLCEEPSDLIFN